MTGRACGTAIALRAPPARVFDALLTPSDVMAYWGASAVVIAPTVGGLFCAAWGPPDAPDYVGVQRIVLMGRPTVLALRHVYYYAREGGPGIDLDTMTTYTLAARPGRSTLLQVRQTGFPRGTEADAFLAACEAGWQTTLHQLRAYLDAEWA